jgi:hypothetical protein
VWTASGTPRAFPQVKKHYFTLGERREEFQKKAQSLNIKVDQVVHERRMTYKIDGEQTENFFGILISTRLNKIIHDTNTYYMYTFIT